jgi:hypothetical protein
VPGNLLGYSILECIKSRHTRIAVAFGCGFGVLLNRGALTHTGSNVCHMPAHNLPESDWLQRRKDLHNKRTGQKNCCSVRRLAGES